MRRVRRDIRSSFRIVHIVEPPHDIGDIVGEPFEIHSESCPSATAGSGFSSCWSWWGSTLSTSTVPAPVLRRSAATDRDCAWAGAEPEGDRLRRAGLGAGRLVQAQVVNLIEDLQRRLDWPTSHCARLVCGRHISNRSVDVSRQVSGAGARIRSIAADPPVHTSLAVGGAVPDQPCATYVSRSW